MFSDYQILAVAQIWPVLFVPLVSMIVYLSLAKSESSKKKLLIGSHGIFLLLSFAYAVGVSPITAEGNWQIWVWPFYGFLVLSILGVFYVFYSFEGSKWAHLIQLLLIPSLFLIWLVGTMTITHDWL